MNRVTYHSSWITLAATVLFGILAAAPPARAAEWEYLSMDGIYATCIEADPVHGRLLVGTYEGFHYMDMLTGAWVEHDEEGWIGREVHSIAWHETVDERILTGRENAFFKGYLELSEDLGLTSDITYMSEAGGFTGIARDPADIHRYYACSWHDINPGDVVRSFDGGQTWTLLTGTIHHAMTGIDVGPEGAVYVGGSSRVTRSTDGGDTWEGAWNGLPPEYGVYCLAANQEEPGVLMASNDLGLYRSADGGDTWTQNETYSCRNIDWGWSWAIVPRERDGRGFLVALVTWDDRLMVSTDGGTHWQDETGDLAPAVPVDVVFSSFDVMLYVVTANSGVFRTAAFDPSSAPPGGARRTRIDFSCASPFQANDRFLLHLHQAGPVRIDIYDPVGRRVDTLSPGWLTPGSHALKWHPLGRPAGVYLARLQTSNDRATLKFLFTE